MLNEQFDAETGEILEMKAADGSALAPPINSNLGSHLIQALEGGEFDLSLGEALRELSDALQDYADKTGGRTANGELAIKIKFKFEDGQFFRVKADFTTKTPKFERPTSVLFPTDDGRFSQHKPLQGQLFGARSINR